MPVAAIDDIDRIRSGVCNVDAAASVVDGYTARANDAGDLSYKTPLSWIEDIDLRGSIVGHYQITFGKSQGFEARASRDIEHGDLTQLRRKQGERKEKKEQNGSF